MTLVKQKRFSHFGVICATALFAESIASGSTNEVSHTNEIADLSHASEIADLSLEELMRVKVTSVSRRPEPLAGAASAIYVLTGEDVQRDGFRNIVDSLRYVPGMQVAQVNSHTWAVSTRGFNAEYATKLLVMMDGRSVYTPLNAGVYWDTVDMMQEDLDRIEVIRGPGGTLWGANAVNGVINIISKPARETQGGLVTGGGGVHKQAFGAVRYGDQLGEETFYRVYGKYDLYGPMAFENGDDAEDGWQMARTGFRLDSGTEEANLFTVQGDFYYGQEEWLYSQPIATPPFNETVTDREQVLGANLLARWTHAFENDSQLIWQNYLDYTDRESNLPRERRGTFDSDLQYHLAPIVRNNVVVGLRYRGTTDRIDNNFANSFTPDHRTLNLFSAFIQDEITLVEDHLRLTLGTKLEHNDFTGFEYQPSGRLAWTPSEFHTVWTSVSRAVRTPSRAEDDVRINRSVPSPPFPLGSVVSILGDPSGRSEELLAYEVGYRAMLCPQVTVDVAAFYNVYDELRSLEPGAPPTDPPVPAGTFYVENELKGESWGVEVAADWQMLDWWRWRGTYTYFHLDLDLADGGTDVTTIRLLEGNAPRHQCTLRSLMEFPHNVGVDAGLRFVDSLESPHIPAYTALDIRLSWRPIPNLELALVGLNLLDPSHPEFAPTQVVTPIREVRRSVYGQLTWRF